MRYNWNKNTLLSIIKKLTILINNTDDLDLKCFYQKTLDSLNNIYFNFFTNFKNNRKISSKDMLFNITNCFTAFGRYYSELGILLKDIICFDESLESINNAIEQNNIEIFTTKRLTHERTYSLVNDFYKNFDKDIYQHFLKHYNNRYKYTKFTSPSSDNYNEFKQSGDCLYIAGVDINLITLEDNIAIIKYNDLVHECGHAIANFINPRASQCEKLNVLSEVESLFPELLSLYEDNNVFTNLERRYMEFAKINTYYYIAKLLSVHKQIVNLWQEYNFDDSKDFFKELKNKYKINKDFLNDLSDLYIDQDGAYFFSYVLTLNLLHIYKDNKKEALNLYKYVINNQNKRDSLEILKSYSDISSSLKIEVENIVNNLTLELSKEGINI